MPSSCLVMRMRGDGTYLSAMLDLMLRDRERVAGPAPRSNGSSCTGGPHGTAQRVDVVCAREPLAVDEKLGVPATPLRSALSTSATTRSLQVCSRSSRVKRSTSRPSWFAVTDQFFGRKLGLMVEQDVVHRPEGPLCRGGLGRFGGQLGPGCTSLRGRCRHT